MSFLHYFGFRDHPFQLTPNAEYFYDQGKHDALFAALIYAVTRGEGIAKLTGEVGTGKTLLCRMLMRHLSDDYAIAYLNNPQDDKQWIIRNVAREFGIDTEKEKDLLNALNLLLIERAEAGKGALIIVDEAQALGEEGLEAIRLLSNLETDRKKLLQIVLFGQPELDEILSRHAMRQVNQRILFSLHTEALETEEMRGYVGYRLTRATGNPHALENLFSEGALRLIMRAANGVPRLINILADKALLASYAEGGLRVEKQHARMAIRDSRQLLKSGGRPGFIDVRDLGFWLSMGGLLMLAAALGIWLGFTPAGREIVAKIIAWLPG